MDAVIYGNWSTAEEVFESFENAQGVYGDKQTIPEKGSIEMIFATYGHGSYDGSAFVLYRQDGKLFTVQGSHCSCFGLEGQWSPVEVTKESLLHEIEKGKLGKDSYYNDEEHNFAPKLLEVLKTL